MIKKASHFLLLILAFTSVLMIDGCGGYDISDIVTEEDTATKAIIDADFETPDWTVESHSQDTDPNFDEVFDDSKVKRMDFIIDENNWQIMLEDMTETYGIFGKHSAINELITPDNDPVFVPANVFYNDQQWYQVGIRFEGNASLQNSWQQGILKLPFKIDFDYFEEDYPQIKNQRFFGFERFSLKNNYLDPSFMREKVASDVFRDAGLAVSHTAFYVLYIDHGEGPEYFGLYTLVEEVDDTLINTQFISDEGNLYKPEEGSANFVEGTFSEEDFEKKTNEDEEDWSDIMDLFEALHAGNATSDPATWRQNLEGIFDVDNFLKYLAVNSIIQNWDTYGRMSHNYYLYNNPENQKLTWIPWDNNQALQEGNMISALDLDFSNISSNDWPLIEKLYSDDVYKSRYDYYLSEVINNAFTTKKIQDTYERYVEIIKNYATTELPGYSFSSGANDFYSAIDELYDHAEDRNKAVNSYLEAQQLLTE